MNASTLDLTILTDEKSESGATVFKLGYRPELDGFRGISIILVFIHHLYHPLLPGGFLGVDMFFVLSGFLITSLLLGEWREYGSISLKNFYIRRVCRLMPAVFFLILALAAFALLFQNKAGAEKTFQGIWLTLSYASNWFYAFNAVSADNPLGVTWSLAIEEQFYLLFPLFLYFALKNKFASRQIIYVLIFLIAVVSLHRAFLAASGANTQRLYYASDTRADALLIGCLVAFLVSQNFSLVNRIQRYLKAGAFVSLIFLLTMFATANWSDAVLYQMGGYSFVALSVAILLAAVVICQPKLTVKALSSAPLVWIGRVSYGLYLWHWTVRYFIYDKEVLPPSNLHLAAAIFLSLAFTFFSFYLVEQPFLKVKKLFNRERGLVKT
jgi:peptidoglycan/LPS O-acetylase OafA/YrhL